MKTVKQIKQILTFGIKRNWFFQLKIHIFSSNDSFKILIKNQINQISRKKNSYKKLFSFYIDYWKFSNYIRNLISYSFPDYIGIIGEKHVDLFQETST